MASKGSYVRGTDGTDFRHRQQVVSTHTQRYNFLFIFLWNLYIFLYFVLNSARLKSSLKLTLYLQSILNLIVFLKLSEDILDRADIFILELQELRIPKPDLWEWLYASSVIAIFVAIRSFKTNSSGMIKFFLMLVTGLSILPLFIGQLKYFSDFIKFTQVKNVEEIKFVWRNWPVSVFFEIFSVAALQVHFAQVYYGYRLLKLWTQYKRD